jgi:hypothetical protein
MRYVLHRCALVLQPKKTSESGTPLLCETSRDYEVKTDLHVRSKESIELTGLLRMLQNGKESG